jgi:ankyrin repeat protein
MCCQVLVRVNATDANGDSAVMLAARNGHEHVASFLRKEYTGGRRGHHHHSSSGVARWAIEVSPSKIEIGSRSTEWLLLRGVGRGYVWCCTGVQIPPLKTCCHPCLALCVLMIMRLYDLLHPTPSDVPR